jgi:L,D-transpeptidase YcbB
VAASLSHGLSPQNYHAALIERLADTPYEAREAAGRVDIELLYTDALLTLAGDLLEGRARRVELDDSAIDSSEDIDVNETVRAAVEAGALRRVLERTAPEPEAYARLRQALSRLRDLDRAEKPFSLPPRTLRPGDTGGEIAALRRRLAFLGDLPEAYDDGSNVMDEPLVDAVKRFQARHGLLVDGIVGRETRPALETPMSIRIEQVELNLERWRWLPRDPGERYLVVNIAGQELEVVANDRRILYMRVIVGRPFQRTPSFASRIDTIVLNPYWEVPYSIAVNEILPKLRIDPGYLDRENMQVLPRLDGAGRPIDPLSIDWDQVSARNFPYRFRQEPGPDNSLGLVKFLMPNPYSVYLHDTPAKSLFAQARRCYSHGCVRLEKPFELATLLLRDEPGWSVERVERTLETERNHHIHLRRAMPVFLVYWTAWMDNQGIIHFRDDVYGRDQRLRAALAALRP